MPYDRDGNTLTMAQTIDQWAPVAYEELTKSATKYNGFVTYKQLAETVQSTTGVTHKGLLTNWIGGLLERVMRRCHDEGIPHITSLCVKEDGTVGAVYKNVLIIQGITLDEYTPELLDDHAAKTRLECYEHFGAEMPPHGGVPTLTPKVQAARARVKAKEPKPDILCPGCNTTLPATGRCDECG